MPGICRIPSQSYRQAIFGATALEPALVAEAKLADHGWSEHLGVGDCRVQIAKIILLAESGERTRIVVAES